MHITTFSVLDFLQILLLVMMNTNGEIRSSSSNLINVDPSSQVTPMIISTESAAGNANTTFFSPLRNEDIGITRYITLSSIESMRRTSEICGLDISNGINVTDRTSTMFTALIRYNCSTINSSELFIFVNETLANNCYLNDNISDNISVSIINVTCDPISNNAGRNWTFTIGRRHFRNESIVNETFTITLEPLSLYISTNITIDIVDHPRSAFVFVANCLDITDSESLVFRCNSSDLSNNTLTKNCTYKCFYLESGSMYNASLIRLPITIIDKSDQIFEEETLYTIYFTDLDKVTNISFIENSTDEQTLLIHFDRPGGYYDEIYFNCSAQDQHCVNSSRILTNRIGNCSDCTSLSISPILRGVEYKCEATTIKENFPNIRSDQLIFDTPLESMFNPISGEIFYSSSSYFMFNVIPKSDFDYIQSVCLINQNETYPCSHLTVVHERCSTLLKYNGILGCNYQCFFVTKKVNYIDKHSNNTQIHLVPPKANIVISDKRSRSITIQWTFNEAVYIKCFELFLNESRVAMVDKGIFSYSYIKLLPNQNYQLRLKLLSNDNIYSDPILIKTLEEAPSIPTNSDIEKKINPLSHDVDSKSFQYVIEIDLSLFSNQYGFVHYYQIYVRQDQNKNTSKLDSIGTYAEAWKDQSIDYLALIIPISSLNNTFIQSNEKRRIIIGNEKLCKDNSNCSIPCNGILKSDQTYKIVVNGCANPGCTSVLSQPFRTKKNTTDKSRSNGWIVILPIAILLIIATLGIWKRKKIRSFYQKNIKQSGKTAKPSVHFKSDGSILLAHTIREMRPKSLIEYINITQEVQKSISDEYKELENISPQYRPSNSESEYSIYNRYKNIPARESWDRTAVRLTAPNRFHDYINANEIKSYDNKKLYIACQGPLEETSQDFWDMIIQYKVSTIVMLTKTEEGNGQNPSKPLSKCFLYFPMNIGEVLVFGGTFVQVTSIEYDHNTDLQIRHITIQQENIEYRLIHYYFTGWPDYNVVQPNKLIDLIQTINKHRKHSYNSNERMKISSIPTVVHCSAGVGRTGSYISVDTIIRLLDRPDEQLSRMKLDVMAIVYQLRRDRVKMVQTKEQYILINRCVEQYLKQTGRLDIILKQSNLNENVNTDSSISSKDISTNLQHSNNLIPNRSAGIDPSPHYVNIPEPRSTPPTHLVDGHRNRANTTTRRSKNDRFNDIHYSPTEHNDIDDRIEPSLPPRRTRST